MLDWINPVVTVLGALFAFGGFVWAAQSWLNTKFLTLTTFVNNKIDKLQENFNNKLEYHERHDDTRFGQISNDLMAIRLRNASRDGLAINILEEINKVHKGQPTDAPKSNINVPS